MRDPAWTLRRYSTSIDDLEQRVSNTSTSERVRLNKQLQKLQGQSEEVRVYEEKIQHLADQFIPIDPDDGVKVNMEKTVFYGQNGESECDMMQRSCRMNYYRGEHFGAVGLDMKYPETMYFVLPDEGIAADDVLTDEALYQLFSDGCNYQSRREV